ncbi:MAG: FtsW/RodA/SpoVE family cell cycle protein [Candidatus Liptonbacteria bacterium]|nr:FtsW/RodA/SpoVE family cell cycle protein [Candidatus Liptonbacteria bacterium]
MKLYLPLGFLVTLSLVVISSISFHLFFLQLLWVVLGLSLVLIFHFSDWRSFLNYRWLITGLYLLSLVFLSLAYFKGPLINQTKSWIALGPFNFQPVELTKVALIFVFARYFSRRHLSIARWKNILTSFLYFALPAWLVALQPDLGSGLVLFGIWFSFLLLSGLPFKRIVVALAIFTLAGVLMWHSVLKSYQKQRIIGVLYPAENVLSINYSVHQSKIAIGSAGFFGQGYRQGSQTQLGFLTKPENDFILAALIEEWGWLVGILAIGAFTYLIFSILKIASAAAGNFEKFICLGAAVSFSWQFFLNIGSSLGFSPVIGVTFPFLSYGGSSLLTSFFLIAIINAIAKKS